MYNQRIVLVQWEWDDDEGNERKGKVFRENKYQQTREKTTDCSQYNTLSSHFSFAVGLPIVTGNAPFKSTRGRTAFSP